MLGYELHDLVGAEGRGVLDAAHSSKDIAWPHETWPRRFGSGALSLERTADSMEDHADDPPRSG